MNIPPASDKNPTAPTRRSRRAIGALALGGLAVLTGLGSAIADPNRRPRTGSQPGVVARPNRKRRRQRRPRFKVVTRTFVSNGPITTPIQGPATPYPSTIQVGGFRAGEILDVNVVLRNLSHAGPDNIQVILVAPKGLADVVLMGDIGGFLTITDVTLGIDDQAVTYLPNESFTQLVSGTYKPTFPGSAPSPATATLREFNGLNPNGTWRLYVADSDNGDTGSMGGWTLTIKARVRA